MHLFSKTMMSISECSDLFQYGETQGYEPLINEAHKHYAIPNNISSMITNGSQQGLDLIARAFLNPGDNVALEAPSYLGALQILGLAQATIHSVQQTNSGPDIHQLEALFSSQKIKLFYAVPDFHNPTGVCWSLATRQQVAALCHRYSVTLIEDAPYRDLRFSGEPYPLVSSFCEDHAIVLRSFSKIAAPGIRLGMVSAPQTMLSPMIKVKQASDLHTAIPMQAILMTVLKDPEFTQHIDNVRTAYQTRYQALKQLLSRLQAYGCQFNDIEGGMFVWLQLPEMNPLTLAESLLKQGVAVVPSNVFYNSDNDAPPALRLNFTHAKPDELEIAVSKIERCLQ
jgi:2-aminoadipate transaminase